MQVVIINGTVFNKYKVSPEGQIWSIRSKRFLKLSDNQYRSVAIYDEDSKSHTFNVHRIVANTFISNPKNLPEVNHIDGDKHNNNVENLEWCTSSQNLQHAYDTGLVKNRREKPVIQYTPDGIKIKDFTSIKKASEMINRNASDICTVCKRGGLCGGFRWALKGKNLVISTRSNAKRINQIDPETNKIVNTYISCAKAAEYLGISTQTMSYYCNKPNFIYKSYIWVYQPKVIKNVTENHLSDSSMKLITMKIKDVDFEKYYACRDGRIWSEKTKRYRKFHINNGYYHVTIKNKNFTVHRIIAKAFIPNPKKMSVINHKNGNKLDNNIENLEWCTRSENINMLTILA